MEKKEKMFGLVALWRKSGLTRKTFAEQHDINMATFCYWCRKQSKEVLKPAGQDNFIELSIGPKAVEQPIRPAAEFGFPSGLRVKIY